MRTIFFFSILFVFVLVACGTNEPAPTAVFPTAPTVTETAVSSASPTATPQPIPSATPLPTPMLEPSPEPTAMPVVFCPEIERPALVTFSNEQLQLTDLVASCPLPFDNPSYRSVQIREAGLYYLAQETVWRLTPDGVNEPLAFTQGQNDFVTNGFVISRDGRRIAWAQSKIEGILATNQLFIANIDGQERTDLVLAEQREDGRLIEPVQIGFDNHNVIFAYQPRGMGGAWFGFVGRYHSLYQACCGAAPQKMVDCDEIGPLLCIGDVADNGRLLAYVDADNNVNLADSDGFVFQSLPHSDDYVGHPKFNSANELVYFTAALSEGDGIPLPAPGRLHHLAPPFSGETAVVLSQDNLFPPNLWLNETQVVAGYYDGDAAWGDVVIDLPSQQFQLLEPFAQTQSITTLMPFTVPLSLQEEQSPDGRWLVGYGRTDGVADANNPNGNMVYRAVLEVAQTNGAVRHTIVDEWRPYGLGLDWPVPFRWSRDGQSLFVTNDAAVDGCGIFWNGSDLSKIDLATGETVELLPKNRTGNLGLSPDEQTLAFTTHNNGERLVLHPLGTDLFDGWPLPEGRDARAGDLRWSPNGRFLTLAAAYAPCQPEMTFSLFLFDVAEQTFTPLLADLPGLWSVQAWVNPTTIRVRDDEGNFHLMDVMTGVLRDAAAADARCESVTFRWFFIPKPALCPASIPTDSTALWQPFANGQLIWVDELATGYALYADGGYELLSPSERDHSGGNFAPFMELPEGVAEKLGEGTAVFTDYVALHQQDSGSNDQPHLILQPDVSYLSLPDETVIALAGGQWYEAGRVGGVVPEAPLATAPLPANPQTYRNDALRFTLHYDPSWQLAATVEGDSQLVQFSKEGYLLKFRVRAGTADEDTGCGGLLGADHARFWQTAYPSRNWWRPKAEMGHGLGYSDALTILEVIEPLFLQDAPDQFLCTFHENGRLLSISYHLPASTIALAAGLYNPTYLGEMDNIVNSLTIVP